MKIFRVIRCLTFALLVTRASVAQTNPLRLWYDRPATNWNEALPLGNGRLGAMVFGGVPHERLQLNEATLYSGYPGYRDIKLSVTNDYQKVADLIAARHYAEAGEIIQRNWRGKPPAYYQPLGDLLLDFEGQSEATNYCRELDLSNAICRVSYESGGVHFARETFVSFPDQAIVLHLTADKKNSLNFRLRLTSPHPTARPQILAAEKQVAMSGQVPSFILSPWANLNALEKDHEIWKFPEIWDANGHRRPNVQRFQYDGRGIKFDARVLVSAPGATLKGDGQSLQISGADSATIILTATSSFNGFDKDPVKQGADAAGNAVRMLQAAAKDFMTLRERHVRDYQNLFDRVSLVLGTNDVAANLPTDARLKKFNGENDVSLAALYFQFGRYLMIAGSRPGGQAMNLMGLWNESRTPAWNGVPTLDMNLEMNYWPAEVAQLSECAEPMFRLIQELSVTGHQVARDMYGRDGWVAHHQTTIWRDAQPIIDAAFAALWDKASGWLCQHLYDHYEFTGDREFLRNTAYPVMKSACEFFLDGGLIEDKNGKLTTPVSTSPENRFLYRDETGKTNEAAFSAGCTMDLAILHELFRNTASAAEILGVDADFRIILREKESRLEPYRVGARGQLQEWSEDFAEREPDHRHTAHLYPLHPGDQISRWTTPALAAAAARSLELRGTNNFGWSAAWKMSLYARLGDSANAYAAFCRLMESSTYPNFFDVYPKYKVMQIDAVFGTCAGIAEMLLQSHSGEIELLPALPKEWSDGQISGLRARGGFEVAMRWQNGQLVRAKITSLLGNPLRVRLGDRIQDFQLPRGKTLEVDANLK